MKRFFTRRIGFVFGFLLFAAVGAVAGNVGPMMIQQYGADIDNLPLFLRNLGLAPSATVDTTNASNITSGTLPLARLPSPTRTISAGSADTITLSDYWVGWNSSSGAPKSQSLPPCTSANGGKTVIVKDEYGDASVNAITETPSGGTIERVGAFVANVSYGSWTFICDGSTNNWTVN